MVPGRAYHQSLGHTLPSLEHEGFNPKRRQLTSMLDPCRRCVSPSILGSSGSSLSGDDSLDRLFSAEGTSLRSVGGICATRIHAQEHNQKEPTNQPIRPDQDPTRARARATANDS